MLVEKIDVAEHRRTVEKLKARNFRYFDYFLMRAKSTRMIACVTPDGEKDHPCVYLSYPIQFRNACFQHELGHLSQPQGGRYHCSQEVIADRRAAFHTSNYEVLKMLKYFRYQLVHQTNWQELCPQCEPKMLEEIRAINIWVLNRRIRIARSCYRSNSKWNRA